jgi:GNAT superfamily N-acetyltransferase
MPFALRTAGPEDAEVIHKLVTALAMYEREPTAVEATAQDYREQLASATPPFECILAESGDAAVGFALYFSNYSTWKGRPGLHLEDLFVLPDHRGQGIGRALLARLGTLARDRGYARVEWSVLDWNVSAIEFYLALGAEPMATWNLYRVSGGALATL